MKSDDSSGRLNIRARTAVLADGVLADAAVLVEGGRIAWARAAREASLGAWGRTLTCEVLMPGFIDMHAHGFGGLGYGEGAEALREASRLVVRTGVTTWYAGLGAGESFDAVLETVREAASVVGTETAGVKLAGIFMEGPYISPAKKGAWTAEHLRAPSVDELETLVEASSGTIRRVNVAPELDGALEFIRAARRMGIAVSIGHSDCTYEQAMAAVAVGATVVNHTFNAMSALGHRAPGLVGAAMTCDGLLAELILDGVHVDPVAARALFRARGPEGVALITDGSQLSGMADGTYERGGRTLVVADGACRLPDGTLAGSISTFDQDLLNARAWLTDDLRALAAMSSGNSARAMGIAGETGSIAPGLAADLVLLDEALEVRAVVVAGRVAYAAGEAD